MSGAAPRDALRLLHPQESPGIWCLSAACRRKQVQGVGCPAGSVQGLSGWGRGEGPELSECLLHSGDLAVCWGAVSWDYV